MDQARFLVGLDQLNPGTKTTCNLVDSSGDVAVAEGVTITARIVSELKSRSIKGLFTRRDDFLRPDTQPQPLDLISIGRQAEEMRQRANIQGPVSEIIKREAISVGREALEEARFGNPLNYAAIEDLAREIQHDIRKRGCRIAYSRSIDDPSDYLVRHSTNSMINMISLATKLEMDENTVRKLAVGALLHDIGKTHFGGGILEKEGELSSEEFDQMRGHPLIGLKIVMRWMEMDDDTCRVVLHHHERFDGRGYPLKLGRDTISPGGRLMSIIDAFDAMTNDRVYARKITGHQAVNQLINCAGTQFDPKFSHEFLAVAGAFPDGSIVELNSGEVAVVTAQNEGNLVSPKVDIFYNSSHRALPSPKDINLADDPTRFIKGELLTC